MSLNCSCSTSMSLLWSHRMGLFLKVWYLEENNEVGVRRGEGNGHSEIMNNFDILFEVRLHCLNYSAPEQGITCEEWVIVSGSLGTH